MDKIKLDFKPIKNKVIKFGKQKIEVKPYLDTTDITWATTECVQEFFKNVDSRLDRFELFPYIRIKYDIIVLNACTNIDFDGVKFDAIISCDLMSKIRCEVYNYNEIWENICKAIELKNTEIALKIVASTMPNEKEMETSISQMSGLIKELNEKDPQTFKKIIETAALTDIEKNTKNEFAEKKAEIKANIIQADKKRKSGKK